VTGCGDRAGVALRVGDRVSVDCTITAIDEAACLVQVRTRANPERATAVPVAHFNAYADQVLKLPEPEGRIDRW
jgi:hypothetical protein